MRILFLSLLPPPPSLLFFIGPSSLPKVLTSRRESPSLFMQLFFIPFTKKTLRELAKEGQRVGERNAWSINNNEGSNSCAFFLLADFGSSHVISLTLSSAPYLLVAFPLLSHSAFRLLAYYMCRKGLSCPFHIIYFHATNESFTTGIEKRRGRGRREGVRMKGKIANGLPRRERGRG